MKNVEQTSEPGRRRRKLLPGVAVFGLLLAAFVGFLLARDEPGTQIQVPAPTIITDRFNMVYALFFVTNTLNKGITVATMATQIKSNGQWCLFNRSHLYFALAPGQSTNVSAWTTNGGQISRGEFVWYGDPTRFQTLRFRLRAKAGSVIPSLKPPSQAWLSLISHTNYSPEFSR
jgi:hypothetical protein